MGPASFVRRATLHLPLLMLTVLALFATSAFAGEQPVFTPFNPGGIYKLGETVGWRVSAPAGTRGEYAYTIKKNNFDVIKSGKFDLANPATIETTLNEPAMVYVEVTGPDPGAKPIALGAAVAPAQLRPVIPAPADFDSFWAQKIAMSQKVPANVVLTPKDSGRPDVDYYILKMDHLDGRHIYGQVAKPKRPGKFPGLVIFQWASPPYPLEREWVTDRAAQGWLAVNIEPHDVLPDQPKAYYDALPQQLKEYNTIEREDRDKNYFMYMYLAD